MKQPAFPPPYRHEHGLIKNANEVVSEQLTVGQRASDWIAAKVGSWHFIIGQSLILTAWAILNAITKSTRRRKPKFGSSWRILMRRTSPLQKYTA